MSKYTFYISREYHEKNKAKVREETKQIEKSNSGSFPTLLKLFMWRVGEWSCGDFYFQESVILLLGR